MKKYISIAAFLFFSASAFSQTYTATDAGSKIHFVIKNFGFNVGGVFRGLKGTIVFNSKALSSSRFSVSVDAATISTGNDTRDGHLRKAEDFDVAKYPLIRFESKKITESTNAGRLYVIGNLTIKGVTKPVEFGFSATPSGSGYNFEGDFEINRRDFGVGGSSISMGDNVKVYLKVAAKK